MKPQEYIYLGDGWTRPDLRMCKVSDQTIIRNLYGEIDRLRALNAELVAALKRLYRESHTLPSADMCSLIEKAESLSTKKNTMTGGAK